MRNEEKRRSCYDCDFLKRSLSPNNSFIYLCRKWQLKCNGIIPYKIVKDSIGRECPFFIAKQKNMPQANDKTERDGFDIVV
jgi:hypothetical protein